jgi:hypothetical protein
MSIESAPNSDAVNPHLVVDSFGARDGNRWWQERRTNR